MILSRLILNPMDAQARRLAADVLRLHEIVQHGFRDSPTRKDVHALHRLDIDERKGRMTLYVQTTTKPDWADLPNGLLVDGEGDFQNPAVTSMQPFVDAIEVGACFRFRLRANATMKTVVDKESKRKSRVPVHGEPARLAWLHRKATDGGFAIMEDTRSLDEGNSWSVRKGARVTLSSALFEGSLRIVDADLFRKTLQTGIGPAKAYGFGLLTVVPMNP